MKIRITGLDKKFSLLMRLQANGRCEVCGKVSNHLQVHHHFGRRKKSVRYEPSNIIICDFGCHRKMHEDPEFSRQFMLKRLGEARYYALNLKANTPQKPDTEMINIWLTMELKKYEI